MSEAAGPISHGFTLTRLSRIEARLRPHDWAWARDNADAVAANWARRRAARPGLFDGPVLLACGCRVQDGLCETILFETGYARFLAFRDSGSPDPSVANAFAAIVPLAADGAVLLGQMGAQTANAGQIYFPCGTPDREDVRPGGIVDLAGSAAREFREETGLDLPADAAEEWVLLRGEGQLVFLQPVRFAQDAITLKADVERHHRRQDEPELARIVIARGPADIDPARMPGFVRAYLANLFGLITAA